MLSPMLSDVPRQKISGLKGEGVVVSFKARFIAYTITYGRITCGLKNFEARPYVLLLAPLIEDEIYKGPRFQARADVAP